MNKKKAYIFLIFLLIFTFWAAPSFFSNKTPSSLSSKDAETLIDDNIWSALTEENYVPAIIILREKANLQKVEDLMGKDSSSAERVVRELQKTAETSQKEILPLLQEEMAKGNIKDYKAFWIVNAFTARINREALLSLSQLPQVKEIRMEQQYSISILPQEEEKREGGTLQEDAGNLPWNLEVINAPLVWQQGLFGKDVVVAIMDTGVDLNHPALKEGYRGHLPGHSHETSWFDATLDGGQKDGGPRDAHGHGTHIAGIILGGSPRQPLGVAPGARWIAVNIFDKGYAWDSHIMQAFQWLMAPAGKPAYAPQIINCSWASRPEYARDYLQWEILHNLESAGILVVFAAGNNGTAGPGSPAGYPHAFSVGALKKEGERVEIADFSSRGPVNWQGVKYIKPEITAPGINIRSSWLNNGYNILSGTSLAAAHVSGAAALLLEARPALSPQEIKSLLQQTASWDPRWDRLGSRPNNAYGFGLLNIYEAVKKSALLPRETLFFDGAEEGIINWRTSPGAPWKITREKVFEGSFAFADSPWEQYKNNVNSWLALAEPLSLCGYHSPLLSFQHFYDLAAGKNKDDYGYVEISIDGKNWASLYRFSGTNGQFTPFSLPLNIPAGANSFYIRFRLESNNNGPGGGWYLDNISITAVPLPLTELDRLKLVSDKEMIGVGESTKISAAALFCSSALREIPVENVRLSSSDPSIAIVEEGRVRGVSAGEVFIRGEFAGRSDEIKIEVIELKTPLITPEPGIYLNSVIFSLLPTTPGAKIYYTLDGSEPDENSALYEAPVAIKEDKIIKAREYLGGIWGPVKEFSYKIRDGAYLEGSIILQGRSADSRIKAFLLHEETGQRFPISQLTPEGRFAMELPLGRYKLVASREQYLTATAEVKLRIKNERREVNLKLLAGDLNGDNCIDLADLTILALAYGSTPKEDNWNPLADLNGDGVVDMADLTILTQNFGLCGDR